MNLKTVGLACFLLILSGFAFFGCLVFLSSENILSWFTLCIFLLSLLYLFLIAITFVIKRLSQMKIFQRLAKGLEKVESITESFFENNLYYILFFVIVMLTVYFSVKMLFPFQEWRGFFYPDRYDLTEHIETGLFNSLKECRDHTVAYGIDRGIPESAFDYECGLNCKARGGGYECKETLK